MKLHFRAVAALSLAFVLPSCAPQEESKTDEKTLRPNVEIEEAIESENFSHWITLQASVEARKNVVLNAEMGGIIRSINVNKGQFVTRGKVLAVIDSDIMSQNISELQSGIELAEYNRDKQRKLFEQNIGTEFDLKQAESQVEQLYRKLSTLRTQAGKSVIVAPFDGYVEDIGSYVGELAAPQIPLIRFLNLDKVTIVAEVSESYLNQIQPGSKARVRFPAIDSTINDLTVTRTGKLINPANRTFRVEIELDNPSGRIVPNLLVEMQIEDKVINKSALIPSKSILEDKNGKKYIFTVGNDSIAKKQFITTHFSYSGLTAVASGVTKGQRVVTNGAEGLTDSLKVDIVKF